MAVKYTKGRNNRMVVGNSIEGNQFSFHRHDSDTFEMARADIAKIHRGVLTDSESNTFTRDEAEDLWINLGRALGKPGL